MKFTKNTICLAILLIVLSSLITMAVSEKAPLVTLNRVTGRQDWGGGNIYYLDRQNVECPANSAIDGFHLIRPSGNTLAYQFSCRTKCSGMKSGQTYTGRTNPNATSGNKNQSANYLDRHHVSCRNGFALKQFKLGRQGNNIFYSYTCTAALCKVRQRTYTAWQSGGRNEVIYLDRQNIRMQSHTVITGFKLETKYTGGTSFRYLVDYCMLKHPAKPKPKPVARPTPKPRLPGLPKMPKFGLPKMPKIGLPKMPKIGLPKMPKIGLPKMPKIGLPKMPKIGLPKMPKIGLPKMPKIGLPKMPKIGLPKMPKIGLPKMPKIGLPKMPKIGLPKMPKIGLPKMPKIGLPKMPKIGFPNPFAKPTPPGVPAPGAAAPAAGDITSAPLDPAQQAANAKGKAFCSANCVINPAAKTKKCLDNGKLIPCKRCSNNPMKADPSVRQVCQLVCNAHLPNAPCDFYGYLNNKKKQYNVALLAKFGLSILRKFFKR